MLNRIYIIVGTLAILVLAGAFIVPRLIDWSDYRDRMEELAGDVLGNQVTIRGDIEFSLLPQPRLKFSDVLVGSPEEPAAVVRDVEADFSLMEFLRDDYRVTRLVLAEPVIDFTIDESGFLGSGFAISTDSGTHVSLAAATISGGIVRLADTRAGQTVTASNVDGTLEMDSFIGPFQFQGGADIGNQRYAVRFNSAALDAEGQSRVSAYMQSSQGGVSVTAEGQLLSGMAPKFTGTLVYRQSPPTAERADDIRGDLVLEANVQGSTDRVVLTGYTLQPDENRASARLNGAASIQLGARRSFDAVISGGVFSLPPRDASEDASTMPYEVVRMLDELPAPLIPPIPGRVGIDLAEVGLRGFSLRNVRLDANTDGKTWEVEQLIAGLPGDTEFKANGTLTAEDGKPAFNGRVSVNAQRLDGLAALWRKPDEQNPLFNMPGTLSGRVMLAGDALGLSGGVFLLDGVSHSVDVRIGFGEEKRLDLVGHFAALNGPDSAALAALLPDIASGPGFGNSFPVGSFTLSGASAQIFGQQGEGLVANGRWESGRISFTRLAADDFGGLGFDGIIEAAGTLAEPQLSGSGSVRAGGGNAPALTGLYDLAGTPPAWREALGRTLPGEVRFDLQRPDGQGAQVLRLDGALGATELGLNARLSEGIGKALAAPLVLSGTLEAEEPAALMAQLGLPDIDLFAVEGRMLVALNLDGAPGDSLDSQITASAGSDTLSFAGRLSAVEGQIHGDGTLSGKLTDASGLAAIIGARGLSLPMGEGKAEMHFEGDRVLRLAAIEGQSGGVGFGGDVALTRAANTATVEGAIHVDALDLAGLATTFFGPASQIPGNGFWPDGPIAIGETPRPVRGSVAVTTPSVTIAGAPRLDDARFEVSWDETRLRLARFDAGLGQGRVAFDASVCCAGPLADKTIDGRLTLTGVTLDDVAPPRIGAALDGTLDGALQFEGTGASIQSVLASLAGEGNFTIAGFDAGQLDPRVFGTLAGLDNVLGMDDTALTSVMGMALGQGSFSAPAVNGAFTIAGGVARLANLIIATDDARLVGDAEVRLDTLALGGGFALMPIGFSDPQGLVVDDTARIGTRFSGTLTEPVIDLDLDTMVAALQVRANELEVDRLEALRAADAERQREAAEERNRLIEEQRRQAEAARRAAEEEARRAAEEEAARQAAEGALLPAVPETPAVEDDPLAGDDPALRAWEQMMQQQGPLELPARPQGPQVNGPGF